MSFTGAMACVIVMALPGFYIGLYLLHVKNRILFPDVESGGRYNGWNHI